MTSNMKQWAPIEDEANEELEKELKAGRSNEFMKLKVGKNRVEIVSSPKGRNVQVRQYKSVQGGDDQ